MATEYAVSRCTRKCALSEEAFSAGQTFYSVLLDDGKEVVRRDISAARWTEAPEGTIAWWRSTMPQRGDSGAAPNEVLLALLDEWADQPEEAATRYLLALWLIRRRVLRIATGGFAEGLRGEELQVDSARLTLTCRERNEPIEVPVVEPSAAQAESIQSRLSELLGAA